MRTALIRRIWVLPIRHLRAVGFLAAMALIAPSACADLILQVGENGGPLTTVASTVGSPAALGGVTGSTNNFTTAHYTISVLSAKEEQTSALSHLSTSVLSITKLDNSATTLNIVATGNGFTAPTTPPTISVNSQIGGSVLATGPTNTLAFESVVAGTGLGAQNPDITLPAAFANTFNTTIGSLSAPYAIAQKFDLFLAAQGNEVGFNATTALSPVVPSPTSGPLGLVGLALLAVHRRTSRQRDVTDVGLSA